MRDVAMMRVRWDTKMAFSLGHFLVFKALWIYCGGMIRGCFIPH